MKFQFKFRSTNARLLFVSLMAITLAGCKTYQRYSPTYNLWDYDTVRSTCRPEADPELALFDLPEKHEVLVIYDCASERHPGKHRRAYFMESCRESIADAKPPHFVNPKLSRGLPAIRVVKQFSLQPKPDATNTWAQEQGGSFTLYRPGQPAEFSPLPVYVDYEPAPDSALNNWWRYALTPVTVPLDVATGLVVTVAVVGTYTAGIWVPAL
jgi:hypothetical protein